MQIHSLPLGLLFGLLIVFILLSAFFSGSETAMMVLNRYRLRHMARAGDKTARRVSQLIERPDRLLGIVLIGNTFLNILCSSIATLIGMRLYGELGVFLSTIILTLVVLIFAEVAPKTLAATHPQQFAFACSWPLKWLLKLLYPIVWLINSIANGLLRIFNVKIKKQLVERLTREELSTMVTESKIAISGEHQEMLLGILSLENSTVADIMIPRNEIVGLDLDDDWELILNQLRNSQYTRLPVYQGDINDVKGIIHIRIALNLLTKGNVSRKMLLEALEPPYFIPETASLHTQLLNFREFKSRMALVVDEYGDIQGLITLEEILEEVVGEFTTDTADAYKGVIKQADGSYLVEASQNIRDLNRMMNWDFDTTGPKTLSGLIVEYFEAIPQSGMCLKLSGYPLEIIKVKNNRVRVVRVGEKLSGHQALDI